MASITAQNAKAKPVKTQEQIIAGFQELRQQQRMLATKISEIEMDMKEHELVIDTLKDVDSDRKCYRMVGGVLVERTVNDVLPALVTNKEHMSNFVGTFTKQLETKGVEINKYRELHGLKIRGEDAKEPETQDKETKPGGVLVADNS